MHVFIAGASASSAFAWSDALESGHTVTATSTSTAKAPQLRAMGAQTVVLDGLDARMVNQTVTSASPDAVVHQMTALAGTPDPNHFDRRFAKTNRLRTEGTDKTSWPPLQRSGAAHVVAQSYSGWHNERRGAWVKSEEDALGDPPPAAQQRSLAAIKHLELEVAPYALDVFDLRPDGHVLGSNTLRGPAASPLVVIDEAERVGEPIQLQQQVLVIEVRPAMDHHYRLTGTNATKVQLRMIGSDETDTW